MGKSDKKAIEAYCKELENDNYKIEKGTKPYADITANKDGMTYYFEIKMTRQKEKYFGAATLTEWEMAIENQNNYFFVIAKVIDNEIDGYEFIKYTPKEFMELSTIPPFKIFFQVIFKQTTNRKKTAIQLTEKNLKMLSNYYNELKEMNGIKTVRFQQDQVSE